MKYFDKYANSPLLAIDIETKDPNLRDRGTSWIWDEGQLLGCSFACPGFSEWVDFRHSNGEVMEKVRRLLSSSIPKIGANIIYDITWLQHRDFAVNGIIHDVQYAEPLLNEYAHKYSLESLAQKYCPEKPKLVNLIESWGRDSGIEEPYSHLDLCPSTVLAEYAAEDAAITLDIFGLQMQELERQQLRAVYDMETSLIPLLAQMKRIGVPLNVQRMKQMAVEAVKFRDELERYIWNEIGQVNISSSVALGKALHIAGYDVAFKSPTPAQIAKGQSGNAMTNSHELERMSRIDERHKRMMTMVKSHRQVSTQLKLFFVPYFNFVSNGRLHAELHPLRKDSDSEGIQGTVSGRFSGSKPNLQQVSAPGKINYAINYPDILKNIRTLFVPENEHKWLQVDFSQIEYRLMAHYATSIRGMTESGKKIQDYFNKDKNADIHTYVSEISGIERTPAKTLNFAIAYGMVAKTISEKYFWPLDHAERLYDTYMSFVPFVGETREAVISKAKQRGWIRTIGGRVCRVPPAGFNGHYGVNYNLMFNRLMQGSCADFMKRSMSEAYKAGLFNVLVPHTTVHDEIDVSMPNTAEGKEAAKELCNIMANSFKLKVPVKVDAEYGNSWGEAKNTLEV